jgi:hypothetical protein
MDNRPRQRWTPQFRIIDGRPGAADVGSNDLQARPVTWPERLGWAGFGLVVLAIWVRVGMWLWGLISG